MDGDYFWLSERQFARLAPHLPTDTRGKSTAPAFIAWTVIGTSACPVKNTIGFVLPLEFKCR